MPKARPVEIESTQPRQEDSDSDDAQTQGRIPDADLQLMVKNFIRLALALEHTRTPIRRDDVTKRVFVNNHKRCFAQVFDATQQRLRGTFGMELLELPAKQKTMTMTQMRKSQSTAKPVKSWILKSILPPEYKQIAQRQHIESERTYTSVLTIILILVGLSDDVTESRIQSALQRLEWYPETPAGPFDEVIARMVKQTYIERVKDEGEGYSLILGPRGKLETLENREEMFEVVARIYKFDEGLARDRLQRILHDTLEDDETSQQGSQPASSQVQESPVRKKLKSRRL